MKGRSNLILTLILMILLSGCNNISKDIETFENLINNDNYQEAFTIYEENKENDEFLKAAAASVNDIIEDIKNDFNIEKYNIDEAKTYVDNLKEFISDDTYNQTVKNLNELYESKNNFSNGKEKEKLLDYESAIMYYEKVIETDINYSAAKENITIINEKIEEKIAENYKEIVVSMKDKVEVEIDDVEKGYTITYNIKPANKLSNEPYAGLINISVYGTENEENSANISIWLARVVPQLVGKFSKVIFYQEGYENVVFEENDMPIQDTGYLGWVSMYGKDEIAISLINVIPIEINENSSKFNNIYKMLSNEEKDITIRMYISTDGSVDIILNSNEREKIKEIFNLYYALKYDNNLINELK